MHIHVHIYREIHTHTGIHTDSYTHECTYTHTHICTCTHAFILKESEGMTQEVKGLAAKSEDLSSIPGIHVVEGENDSHKLSSDLGTWVVECKPTHAK